MEAQIYEYEYLDNYNQPVHYLIVKSVLFKTNYLFVKLIKLVSVVYMYWNVWWFLFLGNFPVILQHWLIVACRLKPALHSVLYSYLHISSKLKQCIVYAVFVSPQMWALLQFAKGSDFLEGFRGTKCLDLSLDPDCPSFSVPSRIPSGPRQLDF